MQQYNVWHEDDGFLAYEVGHPFCDIMSDPPIFTGTKEEAIAMAEKSGRYIKFIAVRIDVRAMRVLDKPF